MRRDGFTLIETMVAAAIMIVIIGAVYGAFRAAGASTSRLEERADISQTGRILLDRIGAELQSVCLSGAGEDEGLTGEDTTDAQEGLQFDKLTFTTTGHHAASGTEPAGDVCRVSYYVEQDDGRPLGLYMEEDLRPGLSLSESDEAEAILLSDKVVGLNCLYYDSDADEWLDEWTDQTRLPAAVRIELALRSRSGAVPVVMASTFNPSVLTAGGGSSGGNAQ
ncbi:MAG: type II secretion system protein GspJ [bacterium]|nr:type II secretion system protein GspJ [bacterium]